MDFNIAIKNREPKPRVINVKQYTNNVDRVIFTFDPLPEQGSCYLLWSGSRKELALEGNTAVWDISQAYTQRSGNFNFQLEIEGKNTDKIWRSDIMLLIVSSSESGEGEPVMAVSGNKGAIIGEVTVMYEGIVDEGIIGEASSIVYPE